MFEKKKMPPFNAKMPYLSSHNAVVEAIHFKTKAMSTKHLKHIFAQRNFDSKMLIEPNPSAMEKSQLDLPPLHYAARHGLYSILRLMIAQLKDDDDIDMPFDNRSPLMWALVSRCAHCVETLLYADADPNFNIDPDTPTPLRFAVEACSNQNIIQALMEFDAEPLLETKLNSPMQFVQSALSPCTENREHWEWVRDLLEEHCEI